MSPKVTISIDRGGTFTDVHAIVPGRPDIVLKLLSVDPANYSDAPTEGIRRVLEHVTGEAIPRGRSLRLDSIGCLRMGTTVATNALLERKGSRSALLVTKGFRDLLRIGNQARPDIFDLSARRPGVLFEDVVEVNERVVPSHPRSDAAALSSYRAIMGTTGETYHVLQELDMQSVTTELRRLKGEGFESVAVALVNSFACPEHERSIGEIASQLGLSVALSSSLQPMIKVVPRGMSATADAYLTPVIKTYIDNISSSFEGGLGGSHGCRIEFMQSDGGLVDFRDFSGLRAILSGPAAGVVGFSATSWDHQDKVPIIGFDMGGTSTDVSRFDGHFDHTFSSSISGISIQAPQLDINTVAAGGGSIISWKNGLFMVGPESASAHPGPACYRKGGPLTVTDANLFLGRLLPEYFPKIFGPNEDQPLDREITRKLFTELAEKINADQSVRYTPEEVALGFIKVADESMTRPIRNLTEARGFEISKHNLASFGGAGGQHACNVAASLGISRIIIHRYSSILSAFGLALANNVHESQEPVAAVYEDSKKAMIQRLQKLQESNLVRLQSKGFSATQLSHERFLNMRYEGSDTALMIMEPQDGNYAIAFVERHRREFSFTMDRPILVDDIRVRTVASSQNLAEKQPLQQLREANLVAAGTPTELTKVYFDSVAGFTETPVFQLKALSPNTRIHGPAIIIDETQTIVIAPNAVACVLQTCIVIDLESEPKNKLAEEATYVDPIRLTIFGHRFMSVAEQMGRTLQKTAVSTNIKERLDFSCALFSPDGGLVANAPHVPVHLGSMQFAVRFQHKCWLGQLQEGDVLVANHPVSGGTHLPDVTVITPVFAPGSNDIIFYVASRGHHADIGGILPGSMPPNSTELWQEGTAIESEKVVSGGVFNEKRMRELFYDIPSRFKGCSGSRNINDNLSDLKAQIAANARGISLIQNLVREYGLQTVQTYMYAIQSTAEQSVRKLLQDLYEHYGGRPLESIDFMDDGTPIKLVVTIHEDGSAIFDFSGTGPEVHGNINAPEAITHSAIIYALRCMIKADIPLNQGCLNAIDIRIPRPCILSPTRAAAVVGGNVTTSQRVTDVVLKALGACAASQGCLNNLTFGIDTKLNEKSGVVEPGFGYYETIAGGAGAGPTWHGESGVHVHMTNTRITDPEILEKRYPCILRRFELRPGTGGSGRFRGGDGVVREIEFLTPLQCSILSERRVHHPYGMEGGNPGQTGLNLWLSKASVTGDDRTVNIGGKGSVSMGVGDRVVIMTPGGGGWGSPEVES
ncbi:Hydantoinase B/oxoprolinase-domain-containing protein [Talaromyces proteolyticus]|uniref:Hydantoinase B/oxoprolinase-domain-containing protein n=1 Tax=Talaromyces proteolyticus TaxID=1131652 RepID=A0AAD4KEY8_9EURO|nr:Hydantoinase B/oxoprolinase-domain-containing protein [Talaromyces proteolyticus]KAH8689335.1 Hydantoinase B/oxoprolinase-domain-containing protein [Talaromyces proteolyticus]